MDNTSRRFWEYSKDVAYWNIEHYAEHFPLSHDIFYKFRSSEEGGEVFVLRILPNVHQ